MRQLIFIVAAIFMGDTTCSSSSPFCGQISYTAQSRGFHLSIEIEKDTLSVLRDWKGDRTQRVLSEKECSTFRTMVRKIEFDSISSQISDRTHIDAAIPATLVMAGQNGKKGTFQFDHGNPPEELESLVQFILLCSERDVPRGNP